MNERDFDKLLEHAVPELPPNDIAHEVTPWRKAMGNILSGSAMCAITINILWLNFLLPTIGVIAQLLGFRALRRENLWFRACWLLALVRTVCSLPLIVINATIYREAFLALPAVNVISQSILFEQLALFFCFWQGLRRIWAKTGSNLRTDSAAALVLWYLAVIALAHIQYTGILLGLIVLLCYVLILRSLSTLSRALEEGGYALVPADVRISDGTLSKGIAAVLVLGILCGYVFFGSYRMNWQTEDPSVGSEAAQIKAELLSLGYPQSALDDLSEEDLLACRGAIRVVVHESDEPINDGREVREEEWNSVYITTVYDTKELHFTAVAVELADNGAEWRIFHHFLWTQNPGFRGTESLQLWPAFRESDYWISSQALTGRVLYEDTSGTTYSAPYASLAARGYTADSIFWGERYVETLCAEFSLPNRSENARGYVAYGVTGTSSIGCLLNSWANYTHQTGRFQYPVKTAAENFRTDHFGTAYAFLTVQDALQFYDNKDGSIEWLDADNTD